MDYILLEKYCKNINVLFVEDDESIRKETYELLNDIFPNKVTLACDGKEAIEKYEEYYKKHGKYFELVMSDIQMPNINGIELTELIYKENPEQKIVILSAHTESTLLMKLINIGIAQFILKPFDYDSFIEVIYKVSKDIFEADNFIEEKIESCEVKINESLLWHGQLNQLSRNDEIIKLTKKEILLLNLLLSNPERTYSNDELLVHLWKDDDEIVPDMKNLKNIIWKLRKKVSDLEIENIYSVGYKINIKD